ncbi:MAG: hypothetical protein PVG75_00155 [Thioalkalispiraceae bacterium]|jgi:hypothetical protein
MNETLPMYDVEEISLEEAVLLLATEEEKQRTDYSKTSARVVEYLAA